MIADRLYERARFVAFPIETVTANDTFAGFTMRKAVGAKPLHQLFTPIDRKTEFPDANFRFMVRAALNLAGEISNINKLDAIVGDINESGALVDQKGRITVIDSDSFQYRSSGRVFRCLVGKAEYTPPELQGHSFKQVVRTVNHDAFGLATLIFEILFMGRHPFSGTYKGAGEQLSISKAIQEGRFVYSPHKALTQMEPPPHVPVLADIPVEIAVAFERAFGSPSSKVQIRPTPAEWVPLLEKMDKGIIECKANPAHFYSKTATRCPWCRYEAGSRTVLFVLQQPISFSSTFDLDGVLARINQIQSPGTAPDLTSVLTIANLKPSETAKKLKLQIWARKAAGLAVAGVGIFLMFVGMGWGFLALLPASILFIAEPSGPAAVHRERSRAESAWKSSIENWNRNAGSAKFDEKKDGLLRTAATYRALPDTERTMLQALETKKRDLQMRKHLEAHRISSANIDSIGDGRKMTLRSFGIETAWDVSAHSVRAVPRFGPVLTKNLTNWRRSVEARFSFNPNIPTDPAEIVKVRAEIAKRRSSIEAELLKGAPSLETIKAETMVRRADAKQYRATYMAYAQAELDHKYLKDRFTF